MNERIRELYEQAHEEQSPISGQGRLTKDILWEQPKKFNPEKFAELLLQECVDACWRAQCHLRNSKWRWIVCVRLKQHFGVEE